MIQGRYLVVHLIGKGGMGEVYLAVDQRLGSAVALKRTSFADDAMLAAAFEREAKILARLRHPVLPKVSDHFVDKGEQYLIMEHISGDDLTKRLESAKKPFPVNWVMFWADQLLDALSYLHSHEPPIIHRDIKPQNLKLTDENHVVLLDFGLSKDTANKSVISEPGTSGSIVGYTPHFAPMEQIRGTGTNPRSDIYALSATLYQLITNIVPADALSRADSLLNGKADPLEPISDINPEVSPAVSNVILKGLEVPQDKRFSTASEMQKALRSAYAQIQTGMSAETMVFNVDEPVGGGDLHMTGPPLRTNAPVAPSEMETITVGKAFPAPKPEVVSEPNLMEATIQMDVEDSPTVLRQADVPTAVILAADMPVVEAVPVQSVSASPAAPVTEEFVDFREADAADGSLTDGFEPAATVPFISLDQAEPAAEVRPSEPEFASAAAASASAPAQVIVAKAPPSKKSGSKAGLILGGLAGLFILAIVGLGGGWYVYTNYLGKADVKPTPSPAPSLASSPMPSPTAESSPTPDTDSNSNVNSSTIDSSVVPTPTPEPFSTAKPGSQTAPTRATTTKTPATPGTKATPKPKVKNDRTVIEQ